LILKGAILVEKTKSKNRKANFKRRKGNFKRRKRQLGCQNKNREQGSSTPNAVLYNDTYTITVTKVKSKLGCGELFFKIFPFLFLAG